MLVYCSRNLFYLSIFLSYKISFAVTHNYFTQMVKLFRAVSSAWNINEQKKRKYCSSLSFLWLRPYIYFYVGLYKILIFRCIYFTVILVLFLFPDNTAEGEPITWVLLLSQVASPWASCYTCFLFGFYFLCAKKGKWK